MTSEQVRRMFNTKMRNIMLKNARDKQEQDDKDREAWEKRQKDNATRSMMLTGAVL